MPIESMSAEDYRSIATNQKNKYRNQITEVDGIRFHSKAESKRYDELKMMLDAGLIAEFELQPEFRIVINGQKICTYIADFRYLDLETGETKVEDVKSPITRTPVYRLKAKLVKACYGITITEVMP